MSRIHDKATKLLNDARKKHIPASKDHRDENNKEPTRPLTPITCCYCLKVFFNSSFLLKHILRRHSGEFVDLHKKCLQQETSNDGFNTKYILDAIQAEFTALRKELSTREIPKQSIHLTPVKHKASAETQRSAKNVSEVLQNVNNVNDSQEHLKNCEIDAPDINKDSNCKTKMLPSNEICSDLASVVSTSISNAKESSLNVEKELKYMQSEYNRLNYLLENEILLKDDVNNLMTITENKILRLQEEKFLQLQDNLQEDLQKMLSCKLNETNLEWKSQFTKLKKEIESLSFVVDLIRQKINSDEHLKAFEKRFEAEVIKFLGNNSHRDNYFKTDLTLGSGKKFEDKLISSGKPALSVKTNETFSNKSTNYVQNCVSEDIQECNASYTNLNTRDFSSILAAKMLSLGIVPCASKISSKEYSEKMKEIENAKKLLGKHNQSFFDVYEQINNYAEQTANAKLKKKSKKIRFSEYEPHIRRFHERNRKFKSKLSETYPFIESRKREASDLKLASTKNPTAAARKNFQNLTHPIANTDNTTLSEISLNETINQETRQRRVDFSPANKSFGISAVDGGDGDYFESPLKPESEKQLQSTPLKKNKPFIVSDEVFDTVMSMSQVKMNFVNPAKFATEDKKDVSKSSLLKDVKSTYLSDSKNNSIITNCSVESNSCSSSSKKHTHKKVSDDFSPDSATGSLFHKNKKNTKGSVIPTSVKHRFDKISLSDVSSLESLSSWEGDENN